MKPAFFPFLLLLLLGTPALFAQETKTNPRFTDRDVYRSLDKISPTGLKEKLDEAAQLVRKKGTQGIQELDNLPRQWWPSFPLSPSIILQRCDQMRVLSHPYANLKKAFGQEGSLRFYKDANGQTTFRILCHKYMNNDGGPVWLQQSQYWPETAGVLKIWVILYPVPGTPYQLQGYFPSPMAESQWASYWQ